MWSREKVRSSHMNENRMQVQDARVGLEPAARGRRKTVPCKHRNWNLADQSGCAVSRHKHTRQSRTQQQQTKNGNAILMAPQENSWLGTFLISSLLGEKRRSTQTVFRVLLDVRYDQGRALCLKQKEPEPAPTPLLVLLSHLK